MSEQNDSRGLSGTPVEEDGAASQFTGEVKTLVDPGEGVIDDATHRAGVRHLFVVFGVFVLLGCLPYVVPDLAEHRAWVPGEPIPFSGLLTGDGLGQMGAPGIAAPMVVPQSEADVERALERSVGEEIAHNVGELDIVRPGTTTRIITRVVATDKPDEATGDDPGIGDAEVVETVVQVVVESTEFEGISTELVDPGGKVLLPFFQKLEATARGDEGAITRIAHFGDSTIGLDGVTSTVRENLQRRFGDSGHGFILAANAELPYLHKGIRAWENDKWSVRSIISGALRDGRYGYGGVRATARVGARATYKTATKGHVGLHVSRFDVLYLEHRRGRTLKLQVDDGEVISVNTRGEEKRDAITSVQVEDGAHKLTLRAGAGTVLYGVALERDVPGVVYDSLGIVGARGSRLLNWDDSHLAEQFRLRPPDLIVLHFGGNEAGDRTSRKKYKEKTTKVVRKIKEAAPGVPCLWMSPLDQGEKVRGKVKTISNVPMMVSVQAEVAAAEGCAFFNTFEAMGGEGAMGRWYRSKPRLASSDLRHATPRGYRAIGNLFYKALMKGFHGYLGR